MTQEQLMYLLQGAVGTLVLSLLTFLAGGLAGLGIALARVAPARGVRLAAGAWIQVIQGTPLLVLMGLCFYGPNIAGIGSVPALLAASLAMSIYASAFLGEIWRGCIQAVHKSQWEAAECLGLTRWQRMAKVILPQALRIATPPTVGFLVQIIKNTSVASLVIGFAELSYNAKVLNNSTFQPFLYFGCAALLYFAMCYPLSRWSRTLERKLNASRG
jgi:polar amino acid transport system permease protein